MSDRCPQCGEVPNPDGQCGCTPLLIQEKGKSVFLANLHYFCAQTTRWPEGVVGDLLRQAKKELEVPVSLVPLEDDKMKLNAALDAFSTAHGAWETTQLLLTQLADRQRKDGKIKSAEYAGDDFHITVKLKKR